MTFTDVEGDFDGGLLLLTEDRFWVRDEGMLVSGAGIAMTITFNAAATSASIDAQIRNLTYANSSGTLTASRDLALSIAESSAAIMQGTITG